MPTKIIGNAPYQVPRNADLGSLAYQDKDSVSIDGGSIALNATPTAGYFQNTNISETRPSLMIDFINGKTLDPRITFTRASAGMYYDGKTVVKSEENLCLYSQSISNSTWGTPSAGTWVLNAALAPDGTVTASKAEENTTTNTPHQFYQSISTLSTGAVTCSVYLKAAERTWATIGLGGGSVYANFNLGAGTVGTVSPGGTAAIYGVGNGWYRCVLNVAVNTGGINFSIWPCTADTTAQSYAGTLGYGIYVWGAQVENRAFASSYVPTTDKSIIVNTPQLIAAPANSPRIDHDPITGEAKGLLIEETRTNLISYSHDLTYWGTNSSTISSNATIAPDGTLTADKLIANAGAVLTGNDDVGGTWTTVSGLTAGGAYTYSVYAKAAGCNYAVIREIILTGCRIKVNLIDGTYIYEMGSSSDMAVQNIIDVGGGWKRIILGRTQGGAQTTWGCSIKPGLTAGDGFNGVYIWGVQLEAATYPTTLILSSGAQATRATESASLTGSNFTSWFNPQQGTLYSESSQPYIFPASRTSFCVSDGTTGNRANLYRQGGGGLNFYSNTIGGQYTGVYQTANAIAKQAGSYDNSALAYNYSLSTNGSVTNTLTAAPLNSALYDRAFIGSAYSDSFEPYNGHIRKVAFYPKRLSDAELQEMTL